jgi:predicted transcriptional regulator
VAAHADLTELTTMIVASFVSNNVVATKEMPILISSAPTALSATSSDHACARGRVPVVPVNESGTPDYLIYLEDGHKLRSLRRYIQCKYSLSPEAYRARWNLPPDYPMVAPGYSELRSGIAKKGKGRRPIPKERR